MSNILLIQGFCPMRKEYKAYKKLASFIERFGSVSCVEYNDADYIEDIATKLEHLINQNHYSHIVCSGLAGSLVLHLMRRHCDFGNATIVFCQNTPLYEMSKFSVTIPFVFRLPLFDLFGLFPKSMSIRHFTNLSFAMPSDMCRVFREYDNQIVVLYSLNKEPLDGELLDALYRWRNETHRIFRHVHHRYQRNKVLSRFLTISA